MRIVKSKIWLKDRQKDLKFSHFKEINFSIQLELLCYFFTEARTHAEKHNRFIPLYKSILVYRSVSHLHIHLFSRICMCADVKNLQRTLSGIIGLMKWEGSRLPKRPCKSFSSETQRVRMPPSEKSVTFTTGSWPCVTRGTNCKGLNENFCFVAYR